MHVSAACDFCVADCTKRRFRVAWGASNYRRCRSSEIISMVGDGKIVRVSTRETIELHILAFAYGLCLVVRRFLKWIWDPKKFFMLRQRDQPPPCLVDNSLATHSYVKIKVSNAQWCLDGTINTCKELVQMFKCSSRYYSYLIFSEQK